MKILNHIFAIIVFALCAFNVNAQQTKVLTADKHNEYGLVYCLPTTALEIEVVAEHRIYKRGPYYQYAKKYIGADNVVLEDSEIWELSAINVRSYGIADENEKYLMQLKSNSVTSITVDENGVLLAINDSDVNLPEAFQTELIQLNSSSLNTNEYLKYVNGDFLASQSSSKRAQLLAENLMEIRESKINLSRGTAETMPTDGHQLELMLNSLEEQERVITDAFIGTIQKETVAKKFIFIPSTESEQKQVLFRLSDFAGFVAADDYSGDPVYISVEVIRQPEIPVDEKGEAKRLPKDAVIYNIPGAANIQLSFLGKTIFEQEFEFAQFGIKFGLNPSLFSSKKERSFLLLEPSTGAIRELGTLSNEEN